MSARDDLDDLCQEKPPKDAVRTITDLAGIAGVSAGTVSRALANSSLVKARTRERIQALAREYGFRPNQMASNLRRQKTGVVGVAIPLGHDRHQQVSDSFFMTLLGHLADELTDKGFDLMLRRVIPDQVKPPERLHRAAPALRLQGHRPPIGRAQPSNVIDPRSRVGHWEASSLALRRVA